MRETMDEDQSSVISYFIQAAKVTFHPKHTHTLHACTCHVSCVMQSCLELKNYEAVFAIVGGLESREVQQVTMSWQVKITKLTNTIQCRANKPAFLLCDKQMVTDHLKGVYAELKDIVSPELNYHRYKHEIISLNRVPCVPKLGNKHSLQLKKTS